MIFRIQQVWKIPSFHLIRSATRIERAFSEVSAILTRRRLGQYGRDELLRELERVDADDGGHADALHVEPDDLPQIIAARLQPRHAEPVMLKLVVLVQRKSAVKAPNTKRQTALAAARAKAAADIRKALKAEAL